MSLPYQSESATSKAAADSMEEESKSQGTAVLAYLNKQGMSGATREQIAFSLGLRIASVCARVDHLLSLRLVARTKEKRLTSSGRSAEVVVSKAATKPHQTSMFAPQESRVSQYS